MDDLTIVPGCVVPAHEVEMTAMKGSGPGGQSVNTTDSAVELRLDVGRSTAFDERQRARLRTTLSSRLTDDGVLVVRASNERSQHRNRAEARRRMVALLREGLRPPKRRRPTRVSRSQRRQRLEDKRHRSEVKRLRRSPRRDDW